MMTWDLFLARQIDQLRKPLFETPFLFISKMVKVLTKLYPLLFLLPLYSRTLWVLLGTYNYPHFFFFDQVDSFTNKENGRLVVEMFSLHADVALKGLKEGAGSKTETKVRPFQIFWCCWILNML